MLGNIKERLELSRQRKRGRPGLAVLGYVATVCAVCALIIPAAALSADGSKPDGADSGLAISDASAEVLGEDAEGSFGGVDAPGQSHEALFEPVPDLAGGTEPAPAPDTAGHDGSGESSAGAAGEASGEAAEGISGDGASNGGDTADAAGSADDGRSGQGNGAEQSATSAPGESGGIHVSSLSVSKMDTGTAPFDDDDESGDDSGAGNDIVRSFDTVSYDFDVSVNDSSGSLHDDAEIWIEVVLDKDMTQAVFDTAHFKYLNDYTIAYYGADGRELALGHGALPDYSANEHAAGSQDENAYRTPVTKQVLKGHVAVRDAGGQEFASLTKTLQAGIDIKASCDGDVVEPTFRAWTVEEGETAGCSVAADPVRVSAAANYNIDLTRNTRLAHEGVFDLGSGSAATVSTDPSQRVAGLMLGYCATIQLYNDSSEDKGLKGIELPRGPIHADISFEESATSSSAGFDFSEHFTPVLWDYRADGNSPDSTRTTGAWGRDLQWGGVDGTANGFWAAPGNDITAGGDRGGTCYKGGSWSMDESDKVSDVAAVSGTKCGPYTFTVTDYDFDLDEYLFPDRTQGAQTVVYGDNIGCFSAGYFEVLLQYDEAQVNELDHSTSIYMSSKVGGFDATSLSGDRCTTEQNPEDNEKRDTVVVKNPGSVEKYNTIASAPVTANISNGYMGIAGTYWRGECGDPAAYAGSTVNVAGQFTLSADASVSITDFNYLQVFDSEGFSIADPDGVQAAAYGNADLKSTGTLKFLFAADPDFAGGYDSNASASGVDDRGRKVASADRMYKIKESELIYFDSLDELERAGYVCIGVMLEARGVSVAPNSWAGLTVPMTVRDDESLIGKTVCTVNRVSAWRDGKAADLTWSGAVTKDEAAKVFGSEVYRNPDYRLDTEKTAGDSGSISKYDYKKTEYDGGEIVEGTHLNGMYGGMSLLVLGYKAHLSLDTVDGKTLYNLDDGERTADYVISGIQTEIRSPNDNVTQAGDFITTDLDITLDLHDKLSLDIGSLEIGDQVIGVPDSPTKVVYAGDGSGHGKPVEYSVSCSYDEEEGRYSVHFEGVPVGVQLPDISFSTTIGRIGSADDASNHDKLDVTACITGAGDRRAYSTAAGNESVKTIETVKLEGTDLVKTVDKSLTELDGGFSYSVKYSNNGSSAITDPLYLYDVFPYDGDGRGSHFTDGGHDGRLGIRSISAGVESGGEQQHSFNAETRLYYSLVDGPVLDSVFGFDHLPANDVRGFYLRQLIGNAVVNDAGEVCFFQSGGRNVDLYRYDSNGSIAGSDFSVDDDGYLTAAPSGADALVRADSVSAGDDGVEVSGSQMAFSPGTYKKLFQFAGNLSAGNPTCTGDGIAHASAVFAVAKNLGPGETIHIDIEADPQGNAAKDRYVNSAHSWIGGTAVSGRLDSNPVETRVASRDISGVVWHDTNLNGVRDEGEPTIGDVECTLFARDGGAYVPVTQDVTGASVSPLTTGPDGAYSFGKLPEGDYVVGFAGKGLDPYNAAVPYQAGDDTLIDSDAVSSAEMNMPGLEGCRYCIRYADDEPSMTLHGIAEIENHMNPETYTESYSHEDLGVVLSGYELPETGGYGKWPFIIAGLALVVLGAGGLLVQRLIRKRMQ